MIESKNSVIFRLTLISTFIYVCFMILMILQKYFHINIINTHFVNNFFYRRLFLHICIVAIIIFGLWRNIQFVTIDIFSKTIAFKKIFKRQPVTYSFAGFDGFNDVIIARGKYGSRYKAIGLVRDGRIIKKIDDFYYSNYEELRKALSSMKNLGEIELSFVNGVKMNFNYSVNIKNKKS